MEGPIIIILTPMEFYELSEKEPDPCCISRRACDDELASEPVRDSDKESDVFLMGVALRQFSSLRTSNDFGRLHPGRTPVVFFAYGLDTVHCIPLHPYGLDTVLLLTISLIIIIIQ